MTVESYSKGGHVSTRCLAKCRSFHRDGFCSLPIARRLDCLGQSRARSLLTSPPPTNRGKTPFSNSYCWEIEKSSLKTSRLARVYPSFRSEDEDAAARKGSHSCQPVSLSTDRDFHLPLDYGASLSFLPSDLQGTADGRGKPGWTGQGSTRPARARHRHRCNAASAAAAAVAVSKFQPVDQERSPRRRLALSLFR